MTVIYGFLRPLVVCPPLCLSAHQHISVKNESGQREKRQSGPFILRDMLTEQEEEAAVNGSNEMGEE